jgi:Protein of unknown function (DUF2924)
MDMALVRSIEELRRLTVPALKEKYREVFGEESRSSHKQYLFRRIAWQMQAQLEGGLSERAVDRAVRIDDDVTCAAAGRRDSGGGRNSPKDGIPSKFWNSSGSTAAHPGTFLTRRHKGREVVVKVLDVLN